MSIEEFYRMATTSPQFRRAEIASISKFDRHQYLYADLPKNYQITQANLSIVEYGWLEIARKCWYGATLGCNRK
jgi:Asp-tRNA(Asn)/Glu-tRNA(Gln) amidotransferase B subunit